MAFVSIQFFGWDRQTELCQTIRIIIGSHCPKNTNARDKRVLVPLHLLRLGLHGLGSLCEDWYIIFTTVRTYHSRFRILFNHEYKKNAVSTMSQQISKKKKKNFWLC